MLKIMKQETINTILGVALVASLIVNVWLYTKVRSDNNLASVSKLIGTVSAKDVYPLFICPCCGRTIDVGCCGMAKERQAYVDDLVEAGISKDEITMAYIKKYGLDSFKDESKKEEFRKKLVDEAPDQRPIIVIEPSFYDFEDVSQKQGVATTVFELRNEGSNDLVIDRMETSCGCTTASVVYKDEEGPRFGMPGHGINEDIGDWQVVIPVGETAQLKVYYDPDTHGDFRGSAIREIYVFSNDPIDFEKKVKIELNQVD